MILEKELDAFTSLCQFLGVTSSFSCVLEVECSLICKWDSTKFGLVMGCNSDPASASGTWCDLSVITILMGHSSFLQEETEMPIPDMQVLEIIFVSVSPLGFLYIIGRMFRDNHTKGHYDLDKKVDRDLELKMGSFKEFLLPLFFLTQLSFPDEEPLSLQVGKLGGLWLHFYRSLWLRVRGLEDAFVKALEWKLRNLSGKCHCGLFSTPCYKMQANHTERFGMKSEAWRYYLVGKPIRKCFLIRKKTIV